MGRLCERVNGHHHVGGLERDELLPSRRIRRAGVAVRARRVGPIARVLVDEGEAPAPCSLLVAGVATQRVPLPIAEGVDRAHARRGERGGVVCVVAEGRPVLVAVREHPAEVRDAHAPAPQPFHVLAGDVV